MRRCCLARAYAQGGHTSLCGQLRPHLTSSCWDKGREGYRDRRLFRRERRCREYSMVLKVDQSLSLTCISLSHTPPLCSDRVLDARKTTQQFMS